MLPASGVHLRPPARSAARRASTLAALAHTLTSAALALAAAAQTAAALALTAAALILRPPARSDRRHPAPTLATTALAITAPTLATTAIAITAPTLALPAPTLATLALTAAALALTAPTLALAAPTLAPPAVFDERGSPLLDRVRTCRPLPILLWHSGRVLQAGTSLGRSRLRLRREGM